MLSILIAAVSILIDPAIVADSGGPEPFTTCLDQSVKCPNAADSLWLGLEAAAPAPVLANDSPALAAAVKAVPGTVQDSLKKLRAPAASLIAVQNGAVLAEGYAGTTRLNGSEPVSSSSGFMIGSISKIFTSIMLFQLRDRGLLPQGLDTTVGSIMPGWVEPAQPGAPPHAASKRNITLRALASHTSGLVREHPDGTEKVRILLDLTQSGCSGCIKRRNLVLFSLHEQSPFNTCYR